MWTRQQAIALCKEWPDSFEDYPFHDPNWTVMRHKTNRKSFAMIFEYQGKLWMNVKAEPSWGDFWKATFPAVVPAYHMNKRHWIGIILDGSMTREQVQTCVRESYAMTRNKREKGKAGTK